MSSFYDQEILNGLAKVPTPRYPGTLIVTGSISQPVLTGKKSGEVIVAASKYGKGRLLVGAHTFYMEWFAKILEAQQSQEEEEEEEEQKQEQEQENEQPSDNQVIESFIHNVKRWLVGDDENLAQRLDKSLVCELSKALTATSELPLSSYKVLLFDAECQLSAEQEGQLLAYLENGGQF